MNDQVLYARLKNLRDELDRSIKLSLHTKDYNLANADLRDLLSDALKELKTCRKNSAKTS